MAAFLSAELSSSGIRSLSFDWQGRTVEAVSKSGLAKMKQIANRDRDRLDLKDRDFADEPD